MNQDLILYISLQPLIDVSRSLHQTSLTLIQEHYCGWFSLSQPTLTSLTKIESLLLLFDDYLK